MARGTNESKRGAPESVRVWVTKWALTKGILCVDAEVSPDGMFAAWGPERSWRRQYAYGKQWHRSREDAIEHANRMREKHLANLAKRMERVRALSFDDAPETP